VDWLHSQLRRVQAIAMALSLRAHQGRRLAELKGNGELLRRSLLEAAAASTQGGAGSVQQRWLNL